MALKKIVLALGVVAVLSSFAQASDIQGAQSAKSGKEEIRVGTSWVWVPTIHSVGKAGIGVSTTPVLGKYGTVDLGGIANNSKHTTRIENQGVTVYHNAKGNGDTTHAKVGTYDFVQVGNQDVWFGEWSSTGQAGNWDSRQAFYVGDAEGTSIPTSGVATYDVRGVNKYSGANLLTGTFNADFDKGTVSGSIKNNTLKVELGKDTLIVGQEIRGNAFATPQGGNRVLGGLQGRFFGKDASGLAGLATFENKDLDTSFGGTKR